MSSVLRHVCCLCATAVLGVWTARAVGAETPAACPAPPDEARYAARDPRTLTVPRRPVTRADYVNFVRPLAAGFEAGPDRGPYGPRHVLPALAVYSLEGDPKLGEGIKKTLRHFGDWVRQSVEKEGGVFSLEGATLCCMAFRELRSGQMTPDDEHFAQRLLLELREYQCAWRPNDGLWRGPHHRSQAQGSNHALAAAYCSDVLGALQWKRYAEQVWSDWWRFRDIGINDTGYFYSSLGIVLRTADLLNHEEVFTDREARQFLFDRILSELTPDGAAVPYGSHGGYNGHAGAAVFALELAALHSRDGRYRWGAERLMNFGQARGFSNNHHHLQAMSMESVALAGLVCDDSISPVAPAAGSELLARREVCRLDDKRAKEMFPEAGGVDCNMIMTRRTMPHKIVFRAGLDPGDMYMLMECFPRHDPLNPTAILALERWSSALAEMASEKFVSRENAVRIDDLSGTAVYLGRKDFKGAKSLPTGWDGMETTVPQFADHPLATWSRVKVTNYMGYNAVQVRDVLFVKNRFILVRDETTFDDRFRGRVGPVWNTQHIGGPRGENWINTWFSAHWFQQARLYDNPPWDLLVYHSPAKGRRLEILEPEAKGTLAEPKGGAAARLLSTRYAWEGDVEPGTRLQFVEVLLPHAPTRDATPLAASIEVLADEPGLAAVAVSLDGHTEVAVLSDGGRPVGFKTRSGKEFRTDARAAYVTFGPQEEPPAVAFGGTFLKIEGAAAFQDAAPKTFSRGTRLP